MKASFRDNVNEIMGKWIAYKKCSFGQDNRQTLKGDLSFVETLIDTQKPTYKEQVDAAYHTYCEKVLPAKRYKYRSIFQYITILCTVIAIAFFVGFIVSIINKGVQKELCWIAGVFSLTSLILDRLTTNFKKMQTQLFEQFEDAKVLFNVSTLYMDYLDLRKKYLQLMLLTEKKIDDDKNNKTIHQSADEEINE